MSAFNASNMLVGVYIGDPTPALKKLSRQTDLTFSRQKTSIDISSKTSGKYGERLPGRRSGEITFDAFIETAPGSGELSLADMNTVFESDAIFKWSMASAVSGSQAKEVMGILTKFDEKYTQETGAMYSCTVEITGAPTPTTVA